MLKNREKTKDRGDDVGQWYNATKYYLGYFYESAFIQENWTLPREWDIKNIEDNLWNILCDLHKVILSSFCFLDGRESETYLKY